MKERLHISLGSLNSVASLYNLISRKLKLYSGYYREGIDCELIWDFRQLERRSINMATLTSFLSISNRLRKFSQVPQHSIVEWNPPVFSFLNDVDFFEICKERDLINFQSELVDGFARGEGNPNTRIIVIPYEDSPNKEDGLEKWREWKDEKRHEYKSTIVKRCNSIFDGGRIDDHHFKKSKDIISYACAELALNSIMWGKEDAFIGLQRSGKRITVCVADSGNGFLKSIKRKNLDYTEKLDGSIEALIYCSIVNNEDYGLKRAIETVIVDNNGWVSMSSDEAELVWGSDYWNQLCSDDDYLHDFSRLQSFKNQLVEHSSNITYLDRRREGFCREWKTAIRGSRISFEIPLRDDR